MTFLDNFKVRTKILGMAGVLLFLLAAVAGFSIQKMNNIGSEIKEVAEEDLPLTVKAGANIPEMMIKLAQGVDMTPVRKIQTDVIMIRYLNEVFLTNQTKELKKI